MKKYRGQRRDEARAAKIKFPWNAAQTTYHDAPPIRLNKRDRSVQADARRAKHVTMDFTDGVAGLSRALINHTIKTSFPGKPKRGWAAAWRRAPFKDFLSPEKMHTARMRHAWYRRLIHAAKLRARVGQPADGDTELLKFVQQ